MLVEETAPSLKDERSAASSASAGSRHVRSLDGLRCLALVGVLAVHCGFPGSDLGWLGVDLFFVLSGFLITALLIEEFRKTGSIHLGKFWGRRLLRLMPAYWLYVGGICAAMFGFRWGSLHDYGWWTPRTFAASLFFYFTNFKPKGVVWGQHETLTLHLWSLSVEEQFYFTWPILCLALLRRRVIWVAWLIVAAILINMTILANRLDDFYRLDVRGSGSCLAAPWR